MSDDIAPFRIDVPQADLDDLHRRLVQTRWPDEIPGLGWTYGVPQEYLRGLVDHWRDSYDWSAAQSRINAYPQLTTVVDGQRVHLLHVRSPEPDALALVLTHGWPSSVVEFLDVIGPLTDPRAHGGDPADAFHVVVPSLPGFGFSGPTHETGWWVDRIARAWSEIMRRLGYDRYAAHGGDFGAGVSRELGLVDPEHVVAVHVTQIASASVGAQDADMTVDAERRSVEAAMRFEHELGGYVAVQATRPQTLAYGHADSPVGQLAWIAERFAEWSDAAGAPGDAIDRDALLTTVMLYWLTGTAASSSRIYREGAGVWGAAQQPSTVPTAVAVLPHDIAVPVRRLAEVDHRIVRWTELARGGHFGALEVPDLLVADLREALRDYR